MTPDAAERRRALDPTGCFIVQAPAGSGKTELLIQRYLTLLARVDEPEAVVSITFTKKAAADMRRRVLAALRLSLTPRPEKEHEALTWDLARAVRTRSQERAWELSGNPNRLRIRTIDSLSASLTRQMPWLSRLGAPPAISDEPAVLYREAARKTVELLEAGPWPDAVAALLERLDNDFQRLCGMLAQMLARRDQWLRHVSGARVDLAAARQALESAMERLVRETIARAAALLDPEGAVELAGVAALAAAHLEENGSESPLVSCAGMARLPGADELAQWLGITELLLTREDAWRRRLDKNIGLPPTDKALKARATALIGGLSGDERLRAALAEIRLLPPVRYSPEEWGTVQALLELLPVAVAQLRLTFAARGVADYPEVAMAAIAALGDPNAPTGLAFALDCQMEHLLVDEFQDTSVGQFELIARLTAGWQPGDGRTLFLVGDPMQSIYRFREAEVGLFLKAEQEGIGSVALTPLRLSANFRSLEPVVEWVNATFPAVLPAERDIATGAIPYAPSVSMTPGEGPAVWIHPFIGRDDAAEAARVVEMARQARAQGAATTAILVRSRGHLAAVVPALRQAGLRFRAVEIDSLAGLPLIADLTALTRALLHPADRVAWLAVLRAPWCGLTLADLHAIAGADRRAALWDLARDPQRLAALSADGGARLERAAAVLARALESHPASLRAWVESTWLALGGPACQGGGAAALEDGAAFFNLLERSEDAGRLDVAAFEEAVSKLYAAPDPEAGDELQVMSIHRSKGLEFDAVIIPGLGRAARRDDSPLMMWQERPRAGGDPDLLLAAVDAVGGAAGRALAYLRKLEGRKAGYEAGRLLYVAATRAKRALHLLGHAPVTEKEREETLGTPAAGSLLRQMWGAAEPVFAQAFRERGVCAMAAAAPREPQTLERLALQWRLPAPPASVPAAPFATGKGGAAKVFEWRGDAMRHVGTVAHQMLRRIAEDGLPAWDEARISARLPAYRAALAALGVAAAELDPGARRVAQALCATVSSERGRWLFSSRHQSAACEYAITAASGEAQRSARLDRTFVDAEGVRWVVDYKTSFWEGEGAEAFLDAECERYQPQMESYRRLFQALGAATVRVALYFPLMGAWRELKQKAGASI